MRTKTTWHSISMHAKANLYIFLFILFSIMLVACCRPQPKQNALPAIPVFSATQRLKNVGVHVLVSHINKYDSQGLKHGLWITDNEAFIIMTPYVNGAVDGCEMVFNSKPEPIRLHLMITYEKDELKSVIFFDDDGMISGIIDSIRPNREYPEHYDDFKYSGNNKSYKDGRLEMSGLILLGEEWERDCEYIGQWKIYNDDGSITLKHFDPFK